MKFSAIIAIAVAVVALTSLVTVEASPVLVRREHPLLKGSKCDGHVCCKQDWAGAVCLPDPDAKTNDPMIEARKQAEKETQAINDRMKNRH